MIGDVKGTGRSGFVDGEFKGIGGNSNAKQPTLEKSKGRLDAPEGLSARIPLAVSAPRQPLVTRSLSMPEHLAQPALDRSLSAGDSAGPTDAQP